MDIFFIYCGLQNTVLGVVHVNLLSACHNSMRLFFFSFYPMGVFFKLVCINLIFSNGSLKDWKEFEC